jgi:hypothetical protein
VEGHDAERATNSPISVALVTIDKLRVFASQRAANGRARVERRWENVS